MFGMQRRLKRALDAVRSALRRRGRTPHEADDLVQEAWLRMACYEGEQPVERPEAFLMQVALNLSVDDYRQGAKRGEAVAVEDVVLIDVAPSVEAVVLARERVARLGRCLARLSPPTREIFLACRVDGLTYQEIARQRGISVSTVERHVSKALQLLMQGMADW
ncbi:RNA polymerase sigma factor [Piscinibacter sakaiensis]|uniref:Sigma factor, ECF subfamily n=1 Tax=Piscinibacter sakaiensis TaxID=1547922 RepID=A0A0K8P7Q4_PISS1|nr:RNA polymerase sigma factor [Piscinibacter sakaiensis]GAP38651.1 sigma factor, ECF subfamily [Piscinibacter sakaiensis]